ASNAVEYVGGSVKTIPANSVGTFNFDNAKDLHFSYEGSVYALPYEQITGTELTKGEGHHILRKIPVPSFGRGKETLTIDYKDAAGTAGTLNFELSANQAADAREIIASKKAAVAAGVAATSNDWWGDKYWKTNRNQGSWTQTAQSSQTSQAATPA